MRAAAAARARLIAGSLPGASRLAHFRMTHGVGAIEMDQALLTSVVIQGNDRIEYLVRHRECIRESTFLVRDQEQVWFGMIQSMS